MTMCVSTGRFRAVNLCGLVAVFGALALGLGVTPARAGDLRDPSGERADYAVDRSSSRTSSLIRSGTMTAVVTRSLPDASPPAYEVKIDYRFQLQVFGSRSGSQTEPFEDAFFTPDFLEQLRATGSYESDSFRIQHLGFEDAHTMDGHDYPNCDLIRIYDIRQLAASPLLRVASRLLAPSLRSGDHLDNMEIRAHVSFGLPVLGAVKLDITGDYRGQRVKAGADYKAD